MIQFLVIGAGACGLLAAVKLQQAGYRDIVLLEKSPRLGGTWRDNTYPGVACDVPSHLYSFSFEPNPDWSQVYAPQAEILAYLEGVAHKYGIWRRIRFGQEVVSARFREDDPHWEVEIRGQPVVRARYLIRSGGGLECPAYPDIPGLQEFSGLSFHSARWPVDYDPRGRRVAVIGSAASAVQFIPPVSQLASQLYVFQRTPNWIFPRPNRLYAKWEKAIFRFFPSLARLYRKLIFHRLELAFGLFKRRSRVARWLERLVLKRMAAVIQDADLRLRLTPDYPMGCKRILLSSDFYPALARGNVEVVSQPIERADAQGLWAGGRAFPVDTLIFATGFQVLRAGLALFGEGGRAAAYEDGPEAYKGVTMAGFPNLFLMLGPNSALGHNSVWLMAEAQADYAIRLIQEAERRGAAGLVVDQKAQDDYNRSLQEGFSELVWSAGCQSWYKTAAGKNFTLFPGDVRAYQTQMSALDWDAYKFIPG